MTQPEPRQLALWIAIRQALLTLAAAIAAYCGLRKDDVN
jgi:hypothetical protein